MNCPKCGGKTRVVDNVDTPERKRYRRRKCTACGHLYYTLEIEATLNDDWSKYYRSNLRREK